MKLANPKTLIPLQESGGLQPLPEFGPGATNARNATEQELLAHNKIELQQKSRDPKVIADEQLKLGDAQRMAQTQHRSAIQASEAAPANFVHGTQGPTAGALQPGVTPQFGQLSPSQLPATGGDVNANVGANKPTTPEVNRSTEHSSSNPSVADAQASDPMRHGGDSSNLGKKNK